MRVILAAAATILAAAAPARPAAEGQPLMIEMKNVAYVPTRVTVHAGDTVAWHNDDIVAHTATSKQGGFDVKATPGATGSTVLTRAGTFSYTCRFHPNMTGAITVLP